jgi:histidyl-tRNA synthetase
MLAADTLEALGVPRGQYVIKVNNRKVLDGLLEACSVTPQTQRLAVLRAIDKLDRLGVAGVKALLGEGRKDESGDFTKGAGLNPAGVMAVLNMIDPDQDEEDRIASMDLSVGRSSSGETGVKELEVIRALVFAAGYSDRITIDRTVVRGLEYYTGPVFEAELTAPIKDERGQPIRLGSVVSGGRYDGLVERFTGEKVPATGISIGVSRLLFGLQRLGKFKASAAQAPVVVLVLDRDRIADYQKMAQGLRAVGIRAELYLGESPKMGPQIKYADKRGAPCIVIQGDTERNHPDGPMVTIKDLVLGATLTSIEDREEYLKKQAEAQFAVKDTELVSAVRKVLDRHKS